MMMMMMMMRGQFDETLIIQQKVVDGVGFFVDCIDV